MADTHPGLTDRASSTDPERVRMAQAREGVPWRRWGTYLAERQWGTVREDYSADGEAWDAVPHEHARSRAYRWGEDGLLGICDDEGYLCFALALWNEQDPILKERLFGLTGREGNHGEDVKECYYFLDATPTHSYATALYRYPQRPFPYDLLLEENRRRSRDNPEYELADTGVFAEGRYFDVTVTYAKAAPDDILIRIAASNRGPEAAPLHILPTLWFRNTWSWGRDARRPGLTSVDGTSGRDHALIRARHHVLGVYWLASEGAPALLFTDNETNTARLWGGENRTPYVKDGIHDAVVGGSARSVNPDNVGTKAALHYRLLIPPGGTVSVQLRLSSERHEEPFAGAARIMTARRAEADTFYQSVAPVTARPPAGVSDIQGTVEDARDVQRQAFAGLLWSKQWYFLDVDTWLDGDPAEPPPPESRRRGRNAEWRHLNNADVISMPDTWEYPWYAAWDLAFHCI